MPVNTQVCIESIASNEMSSSQINQKPCSSFKAEKKLPPVPAKKRGRPEKPISSTLPSLLDEEFKNLSLDEASRQLNKLKNNKSSQKYRRNSKSKRQLIEQEYKKLSDRNLLLIQKTNKLAEQISELKKSIQAMMEIHVNGLNTLTVNKVAMNYNDNVLCPCGCNQYCFSY